MAEVTEQIWRKFPKYSRVQQSICDMYYKEISETILNEGTTLRNKLWVFSLLFFATLHVSAYKQTIFRCLLTNHKNPKDLSVSLLIGRNM
jgi:hypothetical protein